MNPEQSFREGPFYTQITQNLLLYLRIFHKWGPMTFTITTEWWIANILQWFHLKLPLKFHKKKTFKNLLITLINWQILFTVDFMHSELFQTTTWIWAWGNYFMISNILIKLLLLLFLLGGNWIPKTFWQKRNLGCFNFMPAKKLQKIELLFIS